MNGSVLNRSVMNVLCYEWSVVNGSVSMGTILKHCYVFVSHEFQTGYCNWVQRKIPLILKVVVAIAYVATILTSKIKM